MPIMKLTPLLAALLLSLALPACVTTKDGKKKFDPWEAVLRADDSVNTELLRLGYPSERSIYRTDKE
jgi:hypothetical protein